MRLSIIIILIFLIQPSFGQDTIRKMKLKPINQILTNEELKTIKEKEIDSLNNSDACKKEREKYKAIRKKNIEKIMTTKKMVEDLNEENKNSGFYYYIVYDCKPTFLDFKECGSYITSSGDICIDFDLKIEKKEKSRLILDGPSGEVFYYEDIKRMPR